jgi:hypothetical protein
MLSKILQPLSQAKISFKFLISVIYDNWFVNKLKQFLEMIVIFLNTEILLGTAIVITRPGRQKT